MIMHVARVVQAPGCLARLNIAYILVILLSFTHLIKDLAAISPVTVDVNDCEALLGWPAYKTYIGLIKCTDSTPCGSLKGVTCNSQGSVSGINLKGKGLKGPLPSTLRLLLPGLQTLDLSNNLMTGTLPSAWRISGQLKTLKLQNNQLKGTLPATWSRLRRLTTMNLQNNQLNGTLPASWSTCRSLASLSLQNNQLTGTLPASWSSLRSLALLNLQGNQLTGPLPASWSTLQSLALLNLANNQLKGSLPESWFSLTSLSSLDLQSNRLAGSLPVVWSRLPSISTLILRGNLFEGPLPESWGSMASLKRLDLGHNNFKGDMPIPWGRLSKLQTLSLRENRLANGLPAEWAGLSNLKELDVGSNPEMDGTLPSVWSSMTSLQNLFLDGTTFTGMLPRTWGLIDTLKAVYVSSNMYGPVPPSWTRKAPGVTLYLPGNSQLCVPGGRQLPDGVAVLNAISGAPQILPMCDPKIPWDIEGFRIGTIVLESKDGRCGAAKNVICPKGQCCSLSGWCGKTDEHCNPYKGCSIKWGNCKNNGTKAPVTKDGFCGLPSRKTSCPAGLCCNKGGVCAPGEADCKTGNGCQSKYGVCARTGNPFAYRVYTAGSPAGRGPVAALALNGTANILLKDRCKLPLFLPPRSSKPCVNYVVPRTGLTIDKIAATFGTNPYQIKVDNLIYSDGVVALYKGDTLAIRPADGYEGVNRWSPKQIPYIGALADRLARPCSGFLFDADKATCFCSYHPEGTYVWPFSGDCGALIVCSNGQYDRMEVCPWGTVADEGDEFNGNSICVPQPQDFKCNGGCSSMFCFCAEYLLVNGLYLNPFDSTRRTAIQCDWTQKGWFGGMYDCGAGNFFDPVKKQCTNVPQTHIPYRKGHTTCDGVPDPKAVPILPSRANVGRRRRSLQAAVVTKWWRPAPSMFTKPCTRGSCCNKGKLNAARAAGCLPCKGCVDGRHAFLHVKGTKSKCQCGIWGSCPMWFNKNCQWKKPVRN